MSWDIVLFNSKEKIVKLSDIDEKKLVPTNFCEKLENHFPNIEKDENHRTIKGKDFEIDYFIDEVLVSNKMLSLYGEKGLFELVQLAKKQGWQIYDSGLSAMIDLNNPKKNGYENFKKYVNHIVKNKNNP